MLLVMATQNTAVGQAPFLESKKKNITFFFSKIFFQFLQLALFIFAGGLQAQKVYRSGMSLIMVMSCRTTPSSP